jgi:mono/diheme cytochrome c family protein
LDGFAQDQCGLTNEAQVQSAVLKLPASTILAAVALALSACATSDPGPTLPLADAGDAALGLAYAQHTCASCHAIARGDMRSPDARARPFDAIANTPGMTRTALNAWLHSSHTNMPDFIVDAESSDDLHAYLMTLRRE